MAKIKVKRLKPGQAREGVHPMPYRGRTRVPLLPEEQEEYTKTGKLPWMRRPSGRKPPVKEPVKKKGRYKPVRLFYHKGKRSRYQKPLKRQRGVSSKYPSLRLKDYSETYLYDLCQLRSKGREVGDLACQELIQRASVGDLDVICSRKLYPLKGRTRRGEEEKFVRFEKVHKRVADLACAEIVRRKGRSWFYTVG